MRESDLSQPVVKYFEDLGYSVNCEVKGIDIVARKDDYLVAIELKLSFNMTLLFQVMDRLKFSDEVYIALPKPKRRSKDLTKIRQLAEILNFGVLLVDTSIAWHVDALCTPHQKDKPRDNKRKRIAQKEACGRSIELNKGGVRSIKIITAYREKCLAAASIMYLKNGITAKELRTNFGFDKTITTTLKRDYYKWFEKTDQDSYKLTQKAHSEIENTPEFKRLFDAYLNKYRYHTP